MKHLHFLIIAIFGIAMNAQVTVSTITSPFKGSGGVTLDSQGNLYVADFGDMLGGPDTDGEPNNIMKLDTNLDLTIYATGFTGASGNTFDTNGILYQSDIRDNAIYKIINGERELVSSDGFVSPVGIAFDSNGNFYVCNCGNSTIRKVTPSGVSTLFTSGTMFACPNGMTVDDNDNLYIVNFSNNNIVKVTPDGTPEIIATTKSGNGHIDYDPETNRLYIASYAGNQIFYLPLNSSEVILLAGTGIRGNEDGDALDATFSTPNGIVVSEDGDTVYVNCAVPLNGSIINPQIVRRIDGVLTTLSVTENNNLVNNITVFPNPATASINIKTTLNFPSQSINVSIYDTLGKIYYHKEKLSTNGFQFLHTIDLSNFSSGTYFYKLTENKNPLKNGKIIIK